jgi:hypothetical protein
MAERYSIHYAHEAAADIRSLRAFDKNRVLDGIEQFLGYEPERLIAGAALR